MKYYYYYYYLFYYLEIYLIAQRNNNKNELAINHYYPISSFWVEAINLIIFNLIFKYIIHFSSANLFNYSPNR